MFTPKLSAIRRRPLLIGATALALVLVGLGLNPAFRSNGSMAANAAPAPAPATTQGAGGGFLLTKAQWETLKITSVQSMSFRTEQVTDGNIATNDYTTSNVFSPYSGPVSKLVAKLGDTVKKGSPLMYVEASEFVQGYNELIAAVAAANTAQAQLEVAEKAENRQHELYLSKAGALKDWLQSQAELKAAQSNMRANEIALDAARNRLRILGKTDKEIDALENHSKTHRVQPEAVVNAPISGTVVQRQVGLGQYIQSASAGASNPIFVISDLSTVWLIANVREADVGAVRVGQPVEVRVLAYPDRVFKAKITWVSQSVDPSTHRVPVRAEVENQDHALKPMMFARFSILTGDEVKAPGVPQSAILNEGNGSRIFVARDDGTVEMRNIETGRINNDMVEVKSGIKAGEKVVSGGALFIDRVVKGS